MPLAAWMGADRCRAGVEVVLDGALPEMLTPVGGLELVMENVIAAAAGGQHGTIRPCSK